MLMLCGLAGSLPMVTAMLALSGAPPAVGVNVTAIVHDEFADSIGPQVPPFTAKSLAFGPLVLLSLTDSVKPDRLVTVRSLVFVGTLAVRVPYASVAAGVTVAGTVGPVVIATICGPSGSGLSVTVRVADSVPSEPGTKVTVVVQAVLAASVVPQVPLIEKSEWLAPLKLSLRLTDWV